MPRSWVERWRRRFRYLYIRFLRLRAHPTELARGLAAGVFAGLFPLFGLQTIIGIVLASVVRGNKLMAAAGTWVSNPFTYLPIYTLNYQVGRWLLGQNERQPFTDVESLKTLLETGADVTGALFLGCFVTGCICSALSYGLGLPIIRHLRQRYRRLRRDRP
ncbi:MAG: DUF2062 domain-containing protein [Leptolyngbya sp. RL_3_1]|nr:DUF2062 domain-containing protein [Leptolyngbya sp. RL_3_1]